MSDAAVARSEVVTRDAAARPSWLARLARNRNIGVGAVILAVVMLAALLAGVASTHDPRRLNPAERLKPPSAANFLGTDEFGRDVFSLVLYGGQVSLLVGATTMALTSLWGIAIGLMDILFQWVFVQLVARLF